MEHIPQDQAPSPSAGNKSRIYAPLAPTPHPPRLPSMFQRPDRVTAPLYVLTTVFNNARYRTRYKLYEDFVRFVEESPSAILYTAEIAFGDREFALTDPNNPRHLQLRTSHELWFKENALNLLAQRLPHDWQYVAWLDADIAFVRHDWADETRQALQHYEVVQMFSEAHDLAPSHEFLKMHKSLMACYHAGMNPEEGAGLPMSDYPGKPGKIMFWHPGYAWAARRSAWDAMGGLLEFAPLGSADYHMAWSWLGLVERTIDHRFHPEYQRMLSAWGRRADHALRRNIGVVPGAVLHYWHGPKAKRYYETRWHILTETQYNPEEDLVRDAQGLHQLSQRSIPLRDRLRAYFLRRQEDEGLIVDPGPPQA